MKLYLVQHGEAVAKEVDPVRPLSERGVADVEKMAQFLKRNGVGAERVLHSGKRRAQQTAGMLAAVLMPAAEPEPVAGIGPKDDVVAFSGKLADLSGDMLVAGHLPFMSQLVAWLVAGSKDHAVVVYQPGSVVCLEQQESGWAIAWMLRPELLTE